MTRPVLYTASWDEDEPTAPGGGRIRYTVELDGPDRDLGEGSWFVTLSEDALRKSGTIFERDRLILNEADLTRVIDALVAARETLAADKARPPPAPGGLRGSDSVDELDLSIRTQNVLKDHNIFTIDDLCSTSHEELTDHGLPKRLHKEIDDELAKIGRKLEAEP